MTKQDPLYQPYTSKRMPMYSREGMVATSQPYAAEAGKEMLQKGGNAVDAAIATAAALTVVEPTSNGIGSDAFALVWVDEKLHGLNASGHAPEKMTRETFQELGHEQVPQHGMLPVTVPGAPGAWAELSYQFGKLSLEEVLAPAIDLAERGFPVSPVLAKYWKGGVKAMERRAEGEAFQPFFDTFAPEGKGPEAGDVVQLPGHARTLRKIAETNGRAFYEGELADEIEAFFTKHDGLLRKSDLAAFQPEWVDPISVNFQGYDVWEIPPNGQGLNTLLALKTLEGMDVNADMTPENLHKQIEAMKHGFADGLKYITDPEKMQVSVNDLLSESYAAKRRALIGDEAIQPEAGEPPKGGTVYLATADSDGNMVSFIQSNYMGFGSGIVVPETGISLQNRGHDFSLDPAHHNVLEPGKRTYHTIIPGFLTKDGEAVGPFGVMGGYMQPQGHLQVVLNTVLGALNPQAVLDAPRWRWVENKTVEVEPDFPDHVAQALARKGHNVRKSVDEGGFGRGQIIWRDPVRGVLIGGTESRTDGYISFL
ncbi:gamma-glutamyltranspeptidase/glutathione hydrolase [Salsuginibacillus halophilus]|uniref:Gamma-glutamyltranspeptidase/glutathione hydrolase n=1 Tax=Salsuginibacillus halophilus TaxID=517424 RepID=A0A2P8HQP7_9BACI|nr:gamma-glutamyltransferase family protein [Salsuginibacillus halophilus]PSL48512.1 gamma-glutamyltranspeptidase/glutathione hydrolase [Salsuginibacillus halophilus]